MKKVGQNSEWPGNLMSSVCKASQKVNRLDIHVMFFSRLFECEMVDTV